MPPWRRASSSTTMKPALCRSRSCSPARVAEPDDEQVERRGVLAPTEERQGLLLVGGSCRRPRSRGLGGDLALSALLALGRLASSASRSARPRGVEHVASTVSCGVVEERHARDGRHVLSRRMSPTLEPAEIDLDVLGDVRRQRLDVQLARDLLDDAAELRPRRLADEVDDARSRGSAGRAGPRGSRRA